MRRDSLPHYGPHPVNLDLWRERLARPGNPCMAVGCKDAMRLLFQLLDVAEARLVAVDEDVREAFMHLEEVILRLPGRWNDPLVPDECPDALAAGYASLNAIPRASLVQKEHHE